MQGRGGNLGPLPGHVGRGAPLQATWVGGPPSRPLCIISAYVPVVTPQASNAPRRQRPSSWSFGGRSEPPSGVRQF